MKRILTIAGGLSIGYFLLYALCAGLTNTFTFFWLALGVGLIVLGLCLERIKKQRILYRALCVLFAGAVLAIGVTEGIILSRGFAKPQPGAPYVIVLGAQVKGDRLSVPLARRCDSAYDYLTANPETKAILSGGQGPGENLTEASAMYRYLTGRGIDPDRLILEERSRNTDENFAFSRELLPEQDGRVVVVTSRFHVYRALGIAHRQGLSNVESMGSGVLWFTVPNLYLREAIAIWKYALCGQM